MFGRLVAVTRATPYGAECVINSRSGDPWRNLIAYDQIMHSTPPTFEQLAQALIDIRGVAEVAAERICKELATDLGFGVYQISSNNV